MLRAIQKLLKSGYAGLALTFLLTSAATADDTEIFTQASSSANPNVLVILDTSQSMNVLVLSDPQLRSRLTILKESIQTIIASSSNINMGLMRFTSPGGAVLFPVANLEDRACDIEGNCSGGGSTVATSKISLSENDAEVAFVSGNPLKNDTALALGAAPAFASDRYIGLIFEGVAVPQGATVTSAELVLTPDEDSSVASTYEIRVESADSAAPLAASAQDLIDRWTAGTGGDWVIPSTESWLNSNTVTGSVSGFTTAVQGVVNRTGWCGGNNLAVFIKITSGEIRPFRSVDGIAADSPELRVTYDTSSATGCQEVAVNLYGGQETDDAEEYESSSFGSEADGYVEPNNPDIDLPRDPQRLTDLTAGLRFVNINIPQGATITDARLQLTTKNTALDTNALVGGMPCAWFGNCPVEARHSQAASVRIAAHDSDDTLTFVSGLIDTISNYSKTSANVLWSLPAQTANDEVHLSPNIATVIQELVDRSGWPASNANLALILSPVTTTGHRSYQRYSDSGRARLLVRYRTTTEDPDDQTVRQRLRNIVSSINSVNLNRGTPIVETFYEAQAYWSGGPVGWGKNRESFDGETQAVANEERYYRVSHPASYTGGTLQQPVGCTPDDLDNIACANELISGNPTYISPITLECQANFNILVTDGEPFGTNNNISDIQTLTGNATCTGSGDPQKCGQELLEYMATVDQSSSITNTQTVRTFTIGFDFSSDYLSGLASSGLGSYYEASSASDVVDAFANIFSGVESSGAAFAGAGVSINQFSRLSHNDELYFSLFKPDDRPQWTGNLRKYRVDPASGQVRDANDNQAIDTSTGFFTSTSRSYWNSNVDGNEVLEGGANERLTLTGRKVFTTVSGNNLSAANNAVAQSNTAITEAMLGADDAADRTEILNWARGLDVNDADGDGSTSDIRPYLGAPLHGEPVVITYSDGDDSVFVGTNDGMVHAFDADNGNEHFSFLPVGLLPKLKTLKENQVGDSIVYGVDGQITTWIDDANNDGVISSTGNSDVANIYFGLRRGGKDYYGVNVKNRTAPVHLWRITGGSGDFTELAQSWSAPIKAKIKIGSADKEVLIFGGGYDQNQDDYTTRTSDTEGRAVFIVDATSGDKLWAGGPTGVTGIDKAFTNMIYSIPSTLTVLDTTADGYADRIYFGDMGGQIWRLDIQNGEPVASLVRGHVMARISGTDAADNRRFFYPPDVSYNNGRLTLAIGSGWRSHPLDDVVDDRLYILRDSNVTNVPATYPTTMTESDLYDATENLIGKGTASQSDLTTATTKGFYIELESDGEKALAQARTVNNQALFTTYEPNTVVNTCAVGSGTSRVYAIDLETGAPVVDVDGDLSIEADTSDRQLSLASQTIPPAPTILFPDGGDPVVLVGGEKVLDDLNFGDIGQRTYWIEGE